MRDDYPAEYRENISARPKGSLMGGEEIFPMSYVAGFTKEELPH
ncbi:MAG: hypothetical protein PHW62_07605 [Candidatus Ratteibacteria bacterium]|nr:hypothetical protein [Candidatus Ratteibacteria bacterium]